MTSADESPAPLAPNLPVTMERDIRHPGPMLVDDYLKPMEADLAVFAHWCGIDAERFRALARGEASFSVFEAVRVARALDLNPERIVAMQTKYDFAAARRDPDIVRAGLLPMPAEVEFPSVHTLHGTLAETSDAAYDGYCWFFQEEIPGARGYEGMHALWRCDTLRIYDPDGRAIYTGTVLKDLDGRMLLPFVNFQTWSHWFFNRFPADLAIGEEHRVFLEQLAANEA